MSLSRLLPNLNNPLLEEYAQTWLSLKEENEGDIPYKHQLSPRSLRALVHNILILELDPKDSLTIRLSGASIDEAMNKDITQTPHLDILNSNSYTGVKLFHKTVITQKCGGFAQYNLIQKDKIKLSMKSLAFPLQSKRDTSLQLNAALIVVESKDFTTALTDTETYVGDIELLDYQYFDVGFGAPKPL
ncbi:PAS domain-containing protein [Temperatibacter marinus]|uniref:PAS domain-containing protein n=1 Tax=Temperatibacter marinus TaxID=1456591 RepID=A0AA52EKN5_9PROT|nr:PAS domain-containing protein [Temperatibacter marinus]WND03761.1 PAS domain-containing protein [Temperatibacter marinus]